MAIAENPSEVRQMAYSPIGAGSDDSADDDDMVGHDGSSSSGLQRAALATECAPRV